MIKIVGHDLMRGGQKIGHIEEDKYVFNHEGKKLGYISGNEIFDHEMKRLGWIEGNMVHSGDRETRLDEMTGHIEGGVYPEAMRAAIVMLLGD